MIFNYILQQKLILSTHLINFFNFCINFINFLYKNIKKCSKIPEFKRKRPVKTGPYAFALLKVEFIVLIYFLEKVAKISPL